MSKCYHHCEETTLTETLISLIVIFVVIAVILYWNKKVDELTPADHKYIQAHKCVRNGFAGRNAEPTYQCDNGIWLRSEIKKKSKEDSSDE